MEITQILRFKFLIYFYLITIIYSQQFKIYETKSEIAFSKIKKYNVTLKDVTIEGISDHTISHSVLSVVVRVPKSEDCKKKSVVQNINNIGMQPAIKSIRKSKR